MKIVSEVQIVPVKANNGLIGFASFVLYETVYCGSVGIFSRPNGNGYRLVYPTRKMIGRDIDVYYPINRQVGKAIEELLWTIIPKTSNAMTLKSTVWISS